MRCAVERGEYLRDIAELPEQGRNHIYGSILGMRTTVDIPDPVYRKLKSVAARQGCSVKELILRSVEREVGPAPTGRRRVRPPLVRSGRPGTLRISNAQIYEIVPFP